MYFLKQVSCKYMQFYLQTGMQCYLVSLPIDGSGHLVFCFCRYHGKISFYQLLDTQRILQKQSRVCHTLSLNWFSDLHSRSFNALFVFHGSQGFWSASLYLVKLKDLWESTSMHFLSYLSLSSYLQIKYIITVLSTFKDGICWDVEQRVASGFLIFPRRWRILFNFFSFHSFENMTWSWKGLEAYKLNSGISSWKICGFFSFMGFYQSWFNMLEWLKLEMKFQIALVKL